MKSVRQTQPGETEAYVEVRGGGRWEGRRLHLAWTQKGCSKLCKMEASNWRPTLHLGVKLQWEKKRFFSDFSSLYWRSENREYRKVPWGVVILSYINKIDHWIDCGPLRRHYSRSRQQTLSPDFSCFLSHFLSLHLNHICLSSFQPISLSSLPPIPPPKKSWASLATAVGCLCVPYSIIKIDFLRRDLAAANRKILYTATRYRSETVGRRYSRIKSTSLFSRYKLAQENSLLLNSNHEC